MQIILNCDRLLYVLGFTEHNNYAARFSKVSKNNRYSVYVYDSNMVLYNEMDNNCPLIAQRLDITEENIIKLNQILEENE